MRPRRTTMDWVNEQAATIARLERELAEETKQRRLAEDTINRCAVDILKLQPKAEALDALTAWSINGVDEIRESGISQLPDGWQCALYIGRDDIIGAAVGNGSDPAAAIMDAVRKAGA